MAEQKLTLLPSKHIRSGGIDEANIVFECKVVQRNDVVPANFAAEIVREYYSQGDFHRVYYGQILGLSVAREFSRQLGVSACVGESEKVRPGRTLRSFAIPLTWRRCAWPRHPRGTRRWGADMHSNDQLSHSCDSRRLPDRSGRAGAWCG